MYVIYLILTGAMFLVLLPALLIVVCATGRHRRHLEERFGMVPAKAVEGLRGSPRIWIHAVSLGEVKVAAAVIDALRKKSPEFSIIVSTGTEHGRNLAKETLEKDIPVIYAPLDFLGSVRMALSRVRPRVMAFVETEIWPAWLFEARRMGIRTALINGRISKISFEKYSRLRPLFRAVLKNVDAFSMIGSEDAHRIEFLGADTHVISINGNAKYDLTSGLRDPEEEKAMRSLLNLDAFTKVFVAGSTRRNEEALILDAYEKIIETHPETVLILAPRHIVRVPSIEALLRERGFEYRLRTDLGPGRPQRTEQVVVFDTFGELSRVYGVGTVVFCGGSLVPLGGQNPIEPAAWEKPVLYGPYMDNFLDAKALLESAGAGEEVSGPEMLAQKAVEFLDDSGLVESRGMRARKAILENLGAAERHAAVITRLASRG